MADPILRRLVLQRFRSLAKEQVQFDNPTFLVGQNGSGKSNFADAIAFLAEAFVLQFGFVVEVVSEGVGGHHDGVVGGVGDVGVVGVGQFGEQWLCLLRTDGGGGFDGGEQERLVGNRRGEQGGHVRPGGIHFPIAGGVYRLVTDLFIGVVERGDNLVGESTHVLHGEHGREPPIAVFTGVRLSDRVAVPVGGSAYRGFQDAAPHFLRDVVLQVAGVQ